MFLKRKIRIKNMFRIFMDNGNNVKNIKILIKI